MRRVLAVIILIFLFPVMSASATDSDTVTLKLSVDNVDKNRLFDVVVSADGSTDLCGGILKIYYDKAIVSYRSVSSDIYEIEAVDHSDYIELVFAGDKGVLVNNTTDILSVKFKSVSSGTFDMTAQAYDFINNELFDVTVTEIVGCKVTVNSDTVTSTSLKSSHISDKSKKPEESESSLSAGADATASSVTLGGDDSNRSVVYIGAIIAAVVILFALGVIFSKAVSTAKKEIAHKKQEEQNIEE